MNTSFLSPIFSFEELNVYTRTYYQLSPRKLIEQALERKEGVLDDRGALCMLTGKFTGRSPRDKYIVNDEITGNQVNWNDWNIPITESHYDRIKGKMWEHLKQSEAVWVRDAYTGGDIDDRIALRIFSTSASSDLFCYNMFVRPGAGELQQFRKEWTVVFCPDYLAEPGIDGTRSENFAIISFSQKEIIIGGTGYTGEIKKAVFTMLNFLLPSKDIIPLHCSVNKGSDGETALFFGLSGTGKTTLSSDPQRELIGDDEHGWSQDKIFNLEGGCYAKIIELSKEAEPLIYHAIQRGALVENARLSAESNTIDFNDTSITENMRASYPLHYITGKEALDAAKPPKHIFLLSCDAYGVLPPVSRLSPDEAIHYFLCGYTAKIAGTESGIQEPSATFSPCFGAPFFPRSPMLYASMLKSRLQLSQPSVWMINTGWTGGPYGTGSRIALSITRSIISAILNGHFEQIEWQQEPVFGLSVPVQCPNVPSPMLFPRNTWKDQKSYDIQAAKLKGMFSRHITRFESSTFSNKN